MKQINKKKTLFMLIAVMICLFTAPVSVFAASSFESPVNEVETDRSAEHYQIYIDDSADLITDSQEEMLTEKMTQVSKYGGVAFVTNEASNYDAAALAEQRFREYFGRTSGVIFLIDMYNRRIQIFSDGAIYNSISSAKANEITDNIYTYATAGDYYTCADKAFDQMITVLEGGRIVTPMRYATNAAFSVGVVFLVCFIIIYVQRRKGKNALALKSAVTNESRAANKTLLDISSTMTAQRKRRHVESSGGGGGFSGGGGGGFSGGGGGFSGGGGGHSF